MRLRVFSGTDIDSALPMKEAIGVCAGAFAALSNGEASMPQRMHIETLRGVALLMPANPKGMDTLALKMVSVFEDNPKKGLPAVNSIVMVVDPGTGMPLALMDGRRLTAIRTGAASGIATDILASEDACIMALFGAEGQALD
jgi:ornithine cyclodeaminase/alanine dehydrogenase-like protein (mu-crystallin family)